MGKLNKILISIIVLLIIILAIVTCSYFRVKKAAQDNLNNFWKQQIKSMNWKKNVIHYKNN